MLKMMTRRSISDCANLHFLRAVRFQRSVDRFMRFQRMTLFIPILIFFTILPSVRATQNLDISGVWEATTPEGTFKILSVPVPDTESAFNFIMLEPGEVEREFGFEIGEHLAVLTPSDENCWNAEERFHFPLSMGGGYYIGETSYCLDENDVLNFHTDDESAIFTDYPLEKIADGIDAAGIWKLSHEQIEITILLYPFENGDWEAYLLDTNEEFPLQPGQNLYKGDIPPDSDGVDAEVRVAPDQAALEPIWRPARVILEEWDKLLIGHEVGIESGWIWFEFERVY